MRAYRFGSGHGILANLLPAHTSRICPEVYKRVKIKALEESQEGFVFADEDDLRLESFMKTNKQNKKSWTVVFLVHLATCIIYFPHMLRWTGRMGLSEYPYLFRFASRAAETDQVHAALCGVDFKCVDQERVFELLKEVKSAVPTITVKLMTSSLGSFTSFTQEDFRLTLATTRAEVSVVILNRETFICHENLESLNAHSSYPDCTLYVPRTAR